MAFGTPDVKVSSFMQTGPAIISGVVIGQTGDTSLDIDLSSYLSEIKSATIFVVGVTSNILTMDFTTIPSTISLTLPLNSEVISVLGNANLSGGFDWGTTNETFTINVNGAGVLTVTLDTLTTDVATTITEIDTQLATAGVTGVEAYGSGNFVGIRTTSAVPNQTIVLAEGTGALARLGLAAGSYGNPSSAVSVHFTVFGR